MQVLEHLALEETPPPLSEFQDLSLPDTKGMSQVAGTAIRHFQVILAPLWGPLPSHLPVWLCGHDSGLMQNDACPAWS